MNILMFGPNGSGKGTQGTLVKAKHNLDHIESGAIFRKHIGGGTELGMKAKEFINRGELVPDDITIPMVLDVLKNASSNGWLLDGFPRSLVQAEKLWEALQKDGEKLDFVIEILLPRKVAKNRIMGRRLCANDNNHPNNIFIDAIKPNGDVCRVCGGALSARADDQDEGAIDKRHDIYYDDKTGTVAAAYFYKALAAKGACKYIELNGEGSIDSILLIAIYISGRFEHRWMAAGLMAAGLFAGITALQYFNAPQVWLVMGALIITLGLCAFLRLNYALGAIVALIHDVLVTVGFFSILNKEFDLTIIAALLTLIGFSLNDTIIVYDRIREIRGLKTGEKLSVIINRSVNQTLSRTILTSGLAFLAVFSLYLFGGAVIHDFALAMLIGIVVGTFSSIYVAAPIINSLTPPDEGAPVLAKPKAA
ncbi:MAG: adenylate kinase [Humidesulfovibrio sp.]|nr:adenylate kinase [Humidesulfovibrio sp.]